MRDDQTTKVEYDQLVQEANYFASRDDYFCCCVTDSISI